MKPQKLYRVFSLLSPFILLFVLISCHYKQPGLTDEDILSQMELRGKVKSVTETDYRTKSISDSIERGEMLTKSVSVLSTDGKLLEDIQYNSEGKLIWKTILKWDNDGKLTGKVTWLDSIDLKNRIVYKYDRDKNLVEEVSFDYRDSIEYKITYKYDRRGFNTEKLIYYPAQRNWNISVSYDENRNIDKKSFYIITEPQKTRYVYNYNLDKNSVEEVYIRHDGSRGSRNITIYDEAGRKKAYEIYGSDDSLIYKSVYKYDEKGNMVERRGGKNNSELSVEEISSYDQNGFLIESVNYSGPIISKTINQYLKFDNAGNWLIRRVIVTSAVSGRQFSYIETEREIEYY